MPLAGMDRFRRGGATDFLGGAGAAGFMPGGNMAQPPARVGGMPFAGQPQGGWGSFGGEGGMFAGPAGAFGGPQGSWREAARGMPGGNMVGVGPDVNAPIDLSAPPPTTTAPVAPPAPAAPVQRGRPRRGRGPTAMAPRPATPAPGLLEEGAPFDPTLMTDPETGRQYPPGTTGRGGAINLPGQAPVNAPPQNVGTTLRGAEEARLGGLAGRFRRGQPTGREYTTGTEYGGRRQGPKAPEPYSVDREARRAAERPWRMGVVNRGS